jgi:hypothetical protein
VFYDAQEHKEKIIESTGIREKARDITCCNRVLRVIEKQAILDKSVTNPFSVLNAG